MNPQSRRMHAEAVDPGAPISSHCRDRGRGALLGLACGDAIGFPALMHHSVRLGPMRACLWSKGAEADAQQILRFPLPFTVGNVPALEFSGSDDTEWAALVACLLDELGSSADGDALLSAWDRWVTDQAAAVWVGIAERSAIKNRLRGLRPPECGDHNPHRFDDSSVARAVPVGLRYAGSAEQAAATATQLASITNSEDGVWAATAMAAAISTAVAGAPVVDVVAAATDQVPNGSWLAAGIEQASAVLAEAGSPLAAVPGWCDRMASHLYTFGTVAAETFPVALACYEACDGRFDTALPIAALIAKQSDSMPAMVGALCGATGGAGSLPSTWVAAVDGVRGITLPQVAGRSLIALADTLIALNPTEM